MNTSLCWCSNECKNPDYWESTFLINFWNGFTQVYSHSLDMPTSRHFCSRQDWQRFLVTLFMTQTLSLWHVYAMFFWMLLRKKPWRTQREALRHKQEHNTAFAGENRKAPASWSARKHQHQQLSSIVCMRSGISVRNGLLAAAYSMFRVSVGVNHDYTITQIQISKG